MRSLVKPRIVKGSWAPTTHVAVGDFTVYATNNRARVNYVYLTSHPSYALLLLLTAPIPAAMAVGSVHYHLIREKLRMHASIVSGMS